MGLLQIITSVVLFYEIDHITIVQLQCTIQELYLSLPNSIPYCTSFARLHHFALVPMYARGVCVFPVLSLVLLVTSCVLTLVLSLVPSCDLAGYRNALHFSTSDPLL